MSVLFAEFDAIYVEIRCAERYRGIKLSHLWLRVVRVCIELSFLAPSCIDRDR